MLVEIEGFLKTELFADFGQVFFIAPHDERPGRDQHHFGRRRL